MHPLKVKIISEDFTLLTIKFHKMPQKAETSSSEKLVGKAGVDEMGHFYIRT